MGNEESDPQKRWSTLTLGYQIYLNEFQYFQLGFASSAAHVLFVILPILILFVVAQKYFVQGITMPGIKG